MAITGDGRLFRYTALLTPIHRIPAGIKLLAMILTTFAVFSGSFLVLAGVSILLLVLIPVARIAPAVLFRNARVIFWYAVFIIVFRLVGKPVNLAVYRGELIATALYLWQLSAVLVAGTLFYETTSTLDIHYALSDVQDFAQCAVNRITRPFRADKSAEITIPDIALLLSLTITFIPRIFRTWDDLCFSWDARGGKVNKGIRNAWKRATILLPLLVERLLAVASDTDRALRNRSR